MHLFSKNNSTNLTALFVQEIKSSQDKRFPFLEKSITTFFMVADTGRVGWYYVKTAIVYRCFKSTSR